MRRNYQSDPVLRDRRRSELDLYLQSDIQVPLLVEHNCITEQCLLNIAENYKGTIEQVRAIEYLESELLRLNPGGEIVSEFLNNDFDFSILEKKSQISSSDFGWVQFFNRSVYNEGGMENENFRGSSPEDKERFFRFTTLGYNVGRIDNWIYHLEHSRGPNSWPESVRGNPYMSQNFELWNYLQTLNKEQLKEYYSKQDYLKKYVSI